MKRESNVVLYLRVNTSNEYSEISLSKQEEDLNKYCKLKGYNIVKVYYEIHSGNNFNRPEWNKLHAFVKNNSDLVDKVLFTSWDRFSRDIETGFQFVKEFNSIGIELCSSNLPIITSNTEDVLVHASFITQFRQFEHRMKVPKP